MTAKIKICGLMNYESADVAAKAGADYLGFVFVPNVRRQLSPETGKKIVSDYNARRGDAEPKLVGLFQNQPIDEVNSICRYCNLDMAQLCGDEPPDYWSQIDYPVMKVLHVNDKIATSKAIHDLDTKLKYISKKGHLAILDKHDIKSPGGTGHTFNWSIAKELSKSHAFIMAGGISPDNIEEALATVFPHGVDVSSGVETNGIKDFSKIQELISLVRKPRSKSRSST